MLQRLLAYLLTVSFVFSSSFALSQTPIPPPNQPCAQCLQCAECVCNCPSTCTAASILQTISVAVTPLVVTFIGAIISSTTASIYYKKHRDMTKKLTPLLQQHADAC